MPAMVARDLLKRAVSACLVVVTAGCAAIHLPPPAVEVQEKNVRFLQLGTTTRDEVLQRLGQPNILSAKRFSVYEWLSAPGMEVVGIAGVPAAGGAAITGRNQSRLLVEFDDAGKVRHSAFAEYRYPGKFFEVPPGGYLVDGSARDLPKPAAPLLKPSRWLGESPGFWLRGEVKSAAVRVSRDGRYVVAAPLGRDGIQVWDLSTGGKRTFASGFKSLPVIDIDVSRDGKMMAAAGFDAATMLWDMVSGERLHVLRGHGKSTWSNLFTGGFGPATVEFAPDGRSVATGGRDGTVKLWDVASGKETASFPIGGGAVESLAFAPRGDLLAAGTTHGDVIVIDLSAGKQARILHGSDEFERRFSRTVGEETVLIGGRKVAFSPSGEALAASDCVAVELWRVRDIREHFEPLAAAGRSPGADRQQEPASAFLLPYGKQPGCPRGDRTVLAFSPDDGVLIASSNLYSVWDLKLRRLLAVWDPPRSGEPADLTLGPGAALLACACQDKGIPIQIVDLAPIIHELTQGGQRAGGQGTAR